MPLPLISRLSRSLLCLMLVFAWHTPLLGQFTPPRLPGTKPPPPAANDPAPPPQDPQKLAAARAELGKVFKAIEEVDRQLPRDSFDVDAVVAIVGKDHVKLFEWVRDQTCWAPYQGQLRGPAGVLMDRTGNSLDRSLLLAALLQKAGHTVRLARAPLAADRAKELLPNVRRWMPAAAAAVPAGALADQLAAVATKHGLDAKQLVAEQSRVQFASEKRAEQLAARVADQVGTLIDAVGGKAAGEEPDRAPAAIADHWWVQASDGAAWIALDPLLPTAKPGDKVVDAASTIDAGPQGAFAIPDELRHGVRVRLLIESSAGGKATEQPVFDHLVRADEAFGQRIIISHWPLNWPGDDVANSPDLSRRTKAITVEQTEWMPVLRVGSKQITQTSFSATGEVNRKPNPDPMARLGKALGAIGNALDALDTPPAAGKPVLTAEWIEYQVIAPGEPTRTHRRQVFDLLGPAARAAGVSKDFKPTEAQLIDRGLALLGGFEVLPLPCALSPTYVAHLANRAMLANQSQMLWLLDAKNTVDRKAATKKLESMTPPPGPLYDLAMTRQFGGRGGGSVVLTHTNVLTSRWQPKVDLAAGKVTLCQGFDIVENGVTVRPQRGGATSAFATRVEQGVLETNAEALLTGTCALVENTANAFDGRDAGDWITVRKADDPAWQAAAVPADVRARVNDAVASGHVAVVAAKPRDVNGRKSHGWWRVDPVTGQTLGMSDIGGGASAAEYAIMVVSVVLCGGVAFLDGKLSVQDAAVCILSGVGGGLAGGLFGAQAVGLGVKIGLILLALGTGIWLNQSPGLQSGYTP